MKTPNEKLVKLISGLVAVGTLASSCNGFLYDNVYQDDDLKDDGLSAIDLKLSKEDSDYIIMLDRLGRDIIANPIIAQEFSKNPEIFLRNYGYTEPVYLDEILLQIVLAMGDDEINNAVKLGDTRLFLLLLKEKGLFNSDYYNRINISEEDKNSMLSLLGVDENDYDKYSACTVVAVCIAAIAVGVTTFGAVLFYVGAGMVAGAAIALAVEFWGVSKSSMLDKFVNNDPVMRIWNLKGDSNKTYLLSNIVIEERVESVIDGLESINSNLFKGEGKMSKEEFRNLIKINLIKNS